MRAKRFALGGFTALLLCYPSWAGTLAFIVEAEHPVPAATATALAQELEQLLAPAGLQAHWHEFAPSIQLGVVKAVFTVRIHGHCRVPLAVDTPVIAGSLAWVRVNSGGFLALIDLDCALAARFIRQSFAAHEYSLAPALLGRAMARLLMHELLHYFSGSADHLSTPLFGPSISPRELSDADLRLASEEAAILQNAISRLGADASSGIS